MTTVERVNNAALTQCSIILINLASCCTCRLCYFLLVRLFKILLTGFNLEVFSNIAIAIWLQSNVKTNFLLLFVACYSNICQRNLVSSFDIICNQLLSFEGIMQCVSVYSRYCRFSGQTVWPKLANCLYLHVRYYLLTILNLLAVGGLLR